MLQEREAFSGKWPELHNMPRSDIFDFRLVVLQDADSGRQIFCLDSRISCLYHCRSMQNVLTITQPLMLYRALVSTNRIRPDPAQLRLALHLQKLYERLKDYEPTVEYSQRLQRLGRLIGPPTRVEEVVPPSSRGIWQSLLNEKEKRDSVALTRVLNDHEEALKLDSPKGLMVHGEVGTGKSMLIDLFADSLPTRKKRRWHFNTFMLKTFSKLEQLRIARRSQTRKPSLAAEEDDHSMLWLARDLIEKSPILFLDEFQLPDRASAKIMTNLMTGFFSLGGVLVTTSNRMPDELAKAAGIEFVPPAASSRRGLLGWKGAGVARSNRMFSGGQGEFAQFLELVKARCEVWEMEGRSDYRRSSDKGKTAGDESTVVAVGSLGKTGKFSSTY
jgi:protein AFG1